MVNDVRTELHYGGVWNDITADVRYDPPITIKWGRADEAAKAAPSSLSLALNNPAGKYSPRNPRSSLFGLIGRNTPIRVRLPLNTLARDTFTRSVAGGWGTSDSGHTYVITANKAGATYDVNGSKGTIQLGADDLATRAAIQLSGADIVAADFDATATVSSSAVATGEALVGRLLGRFIDPSNFYTCNIAFQTGGTVFVELDIVQAGVGAELAAPVNKGAYLANDAFSIRFQALGSELKVKLWAAGTAEPAAWDIEVTNTVFPDPGGISVRTDRLLGNTNVNPVLSYDDLQVLYSHAPTIRFSGEVSSWPTSWDLAGVDVRVPIEASGILRRLNQGSAPVQSAMFRGIVKDPAIAQPVAYWPLEDERSADSLASGIGHEPMTVHLKTTSGVVQPGVKFGDYDDLDSSLPLLTNEQAKLFGPARTHANNGFLKVFCVFWPPLNDSSWNPTSIVFALNCVGGSALRWSLVGQGPGDIWFSLRALGAEDVSLLSTSLRDLGVRNGGLPQILEVKLNQVGADINWTMRGHRLDGTVTTETGTLVGQTLGTVVSVESGNNTAGTTNTWLNTAFGHLTVFNSDVAIDLVDLLQAHAGEVAAGRVSRLCDEEGIPFQLQGSAADTTAIGPQRPGGVLDLMQECADADLGLLGETRDVPGLRYRTRTSLYNQAAALTLDYAAGDVAADLEPVEDDQSTRNDITVARVDGSQFQVEDTTGALSTAQPPDGVGRYDSSVTLNLERDAQLPDQAAWRLRLGTVDEARYPSIGVDLTAVPSLVADATAVHAGDRVQVSNPPAWLPPETIDQIVQGGTEQLTPHRHTITFNASPASPWTVGVVGDDVLGRADTEDSSTTASFVSGTGTSMTVATNRGPIWTTAAGQFPFDITVSGVVLTVTAISGAASPQTFTVTQTPVNSVTKTIPAGSAVSLAHPAYVAL